MAPGRLFRKCQSVPPPHTLKHCLRERLSLLQVSHTHSAQPAPVVEKREHYGNVVSSRKVLIMISTNLQELLPVFATRRRRSVSSWFSGVCVCVWVGLVWVEVAIAKYLFVAIMNNV